MAMDRELWPDHPTEHDRAILARAPDGALRWFVWDPGKSLVRAALPPKVPPRLQVQLDQLLRYLDVKRPLLCNTVSIEVAGVVLDVEPGAVWQKGSTVLQMEPQGGWETMKINPFNPRVLNLPDS